MKKTGPKTAVPSLELLAPAGTVAAFETAVEKGADAIYIGAPVLNARALSRDFTWPEIGAMIEHAHHRQVKLFVAMNSLIREEEIPLAVKTLAKLSALQPDALIIQDLGLYHLAHTHFPELRLHASTLLLAHNSMAVRKFEEMGFKRVVLARELSLPEIARIRKETSVELEIFGHGALCFSYSGLCLFSSSLGGKSGLRGHCVQPCRRRYSWMEKRGRGQDRSSGGYLFSMNDLRSIELLPEIIRAGVTSLKIEGRLRNPHYVGTVVEAYRMALDAPPGDPAALAAARELLDNSMGRKTCTGFIKTIHPRDAITPVHSGNIGLFLGKAEKGGQKGFQLLTRGPVAKGDRLRVHLEKSGERYSFTVTNLLVRGKEKPSVAAETRTTIECPYQVGRGDAVYLVDTKKSRVLERKKSLALNVQQEKPLSSSQLSKVEKIIAGFSSGPVKRKKTRTPLWVKIDSLKNIHIRLPFKPQKTIVALNRQTLGQARHMQRDLGRLGGNLVWALPPIIHEEDLPFYADAIDELSNNTAAAWQLGHISQTLFFAGREREICADYTLNVLNSASLAFLLEENILHAQFAVETDRAALEKSAAPWNLSAVGLTVFGRLPLFYSRLRAEHFSYGKPLASPRGERYELVETNNATIALPEKPFSLLADLDAFSALGLSYAVVDLTNIKVDRAFLARLEGIFSGRDRDCTTFNFRGRLS